MSIVSNVVSGILGGASQIIDQVVTNDKEREQLKQSLTQEMNRHAEQFLTAQASDLANARGREVSLRDSIGVIVQYGSTGFVVLAFIGLLFCVVTNQIPKDNAHLVDIMIGSLATIITNIFGYWFGSSLGSSRKTDAMVEAAGKVGN